MSFFTLAISSGTHDSSICLMKDGDIVLAIPCERVTRLVHTHKVTSKEIELVKRYTSTVDLLVLVNVRDPDALPSKGSTEPVVNSTATCESIPHIKQLIRTAGIDVKRILIDNSNHHLYHAAAGFFFSGFTEALCIVIDGIGSTWLWQRFLLSETTTIYHCTNGGFRQLHKTLLYKADHNINMGLDHSKMEACKSFFSGDTVITSHLDIGKMYGTITRHIGLGTSLNAGKTMGLAAYGQPNTLPPMMLPNSLISDSNFFRNDGQIDTHVYPQLANPSEETKKSLAYNVQRALEDIFVARVRQARKYVDCNNIVMGGGCSLNILGNSAIKRAFPDINVATDPIGSDVAQSLGAAMYHYKRLFPNTVFGKRDTIYLGPSYSSSHIESTVTQLVEQYNNGNYL